MKTFIPIDFKLILSLKYKSSTKKKKNNNTERLLRAKSPRNDEETKCKPYAVWSFYSYGECSPIAECIENV